MKCLIISKKKLDELKQEQYENGIAKGYELGFKMRQVEKSNRGFIIGSKVNREISQIVKATRF